MEVKLLADTALQTIIDPNATLTNSSRAAGDYDNGTELDLEAVGYLTLQYDGGPPTTGTSVAELYVLPGDGEGSEVFPTGGASVDPQKIFQVATFECRSPSTTVDETLATLPFPLYPDGNRFVIKNISGQTFDATWIFKIKPMKRQVA